MEDKIVILVLNQEVDADNSLWQTLQNCRLPFILQAVPDKGRLLQATITLAPGAVVVAYHKDFSAVAETFRLTQQTRPGIPFIFIVDESQEEQALALLEAGAADFVLQEKLWQLPVRLQRALRDHSFTGAQRFAETPEPEEPALLHKIMDLSPDLVAVLNLEGRCQMIRAAAKSILGYSPDEIIGQQPFFLVCAEDKDATFQALARLTQGQEVINFQNRLVHRNGHLVTISWSAHWGIREKLGYLIGRDISNAKKQEEMIRNNEQKLRALLENSSEGYTLVTAEGEVLERSATAPNILGEYACNESSRFRLDLVHPEDTPRLRDVWEEVKSQPNRTWTLEYRFRQKDGTYKWIESTYQNLLQEPAVRAILLNYRDITERKEAEKAIQDSEVRLKDAQRLGKIGHWEVDLRNGQVKWSNEIFRMFGLKVGEVEPSFESYMSFMHPDDRPVVSARYQQLEPSTQESTVSYRIIRKDGELRYISGVYHFRMNAQEQPERLFGVLQDVTDLKRAEVALEKSEADYRTLFEFSPSPKFVYDIETLRFVEVNEAAVRNYGYSKEDFLTMNMLNIVPQEKLKAFKEILNTYKGTNAVYRGTSEHLKQNGEIIEVDLQCTSVIRSGREVRIVVATDISEQLQRIREIEEQNMRFREIAWIQSHVVRAPLARIIGLIDLLTNSPWEETEELDVVGSIKNSAHELDDIIRRIIQKTEKLK